MTGSASMVTDRKQRTVNVIDNAIDDVRFGERDGKVGKYLLKSHVDGLAVYEETQVAPIVTGPVADVKQWLIYHC